MTIGITGTGCYIPKVKKTNASFSTHTFLQPDGTDFPNSNTVIIEKFKAITGIEERRYVTDDLTTSDIATQAAKEAIADANIDKETLDYIIFAHNFGDVKKGSHQGDQLPSLASKLKQKLQIKNPKCVAYDMLFGCPGWVEGVIQAYAFIKSGMAKKCLVIGAETLSRVVDPNDRDSMIYADGAGACIIEANAAGNILSHASETHAIEEANYLFYGPSYNLSSTDTKYIKMHGRKIYEFAVTNVPKAIKSCIDESGIPISEIKKIFIHQANEKMDEAIIKRVYKAYNLPVPEGIMPMSIGLLGNSSVATVPTLFHLVKTAQLQGHHIVPGDVVVFASVGAGMNINAITYRFH